MLAEGVVRLVVIVESAVRVLSSIAFIARRSQRGLYKMGRVPMACVNSGIGGGGYY
jgi:hypothetical protein